MHGTSKIIDTFETYQLLPILLPLLSRASRMVMGTLIEKLEEVTNEQVGLVGPVVRSPRPTSTPSCPSMLDGGYSANLVFEVL